MMTRVYPAMLAMAQLPSKPAPVSSPAVPFAAGNYGPVQGLAFADVITYKSLAQAESDKGHCLSDDVVLGAAFRNLVQRRRFFTLPELKLLALWLDPEKGVAGVPGSLTHTQLERAGRKAFANLEYTNPNEALAALKETGISTPLATTMLMVLRPYEAQPMSGRTWAQVQKLAELNGWELSKKCPPGDDPKQFIEANPEVYADYMKIYRILASKLEQPLRVVDQALWMKAEIEKYGPNGRPAS